MEHVGSVGERWLESLNDMLRGRELRDRTLLFLAARADCDPRLFLMLMEEWRSTLHGLAACRAMRERLAQQRLPAQARNAPYVL